MEVVQIKFKGQRKGFYRNPKDFSLQVGDYALVEADRGEDLGQVHQVNPELIDQITQDELSKVIRMASDRELEAHRRNRPKEDEAFNYCREKVKKLGLNMNLLDCEFQFDGNKITIYFTSENRVDFRQLVRIMARKYRTRIEFRQVGSREGARRLGGCGICGRPLCCTAWIEEFTPVTTQAAKEQNLPINASKLAGVCGRLKCCLMYERDFYNEVVDEYPDLAKPITTEKGKGTIANVDIFNEKVLVKYPDDSTDLYSLEDVKRLISSQCEDDCGHTFQDSENLN